MNVPPQYHLVDESVVQSLPYPLYIIDHELVLRQANPPAAALNARLGLAGVLPGEILEQVNNTVARNSVGDDSRSLVRLANEQSYLPQIFRLREIYGGKDGWAVLLVEQPPIAGGSDFKAKTLRTISHEVRTPLTSIRMSLHLLLEEKLGSLNPDQRELLEVARDECERMLVSLQGELERARVESGKPT